ncbi:MAG: hypothetical protein WDA20_04725 [Desulfuromonadales bacterium]|jgi:hypothetical protein
MPISGSPKKIAQDVAEGFFTISPPLLRQYTPADLKIIMSHFGIVTRELRQVQIPLEDVIALKMKNMKLSRLNQAEVMVRAYCKKKRIPI